MSNPRDVRRGRRDALAQWQEREREHELARFRDMYPAAENDTIRVNVGRWREQQLARDMRNAKRDAPPPKMG